MTLAQILDRLKSDQQFLRNLTKWHTIPAQSARYGGFPEALNPKLIEALKARGIHDLYTHQTHAISAVLENLNISGFNKEIIGENEMRVNGK